MTSDFFKTNRPALIRWKVYFDRSRMYIGYIQFFMIGWVFIKSFKSSFWGDYLSRYALILIPLLFLLFIIITLFMGYLDLKLGLREEEFKNLSQSNPVVMEMFNSIKSIEKDIQEIKKTGRQSNPQS